MPVPRVAVEPAGTQRLHPLRGPTQPRPADQVPIRWSSAMSRCTSGMTSRTANRSSTRPTSSPTSPTAAAPRDYYPQQRLFRAGPGDASAVRPRERRGLRALQVRAQHPDRAGVHPARLRRAGVLRRFHHHVRRRRRTEDRGRQQRRRGHQRRTRHRGDQELGNDRQPHHLGDHPRRRLHLRRAVHGVHRPPARQTPPRIPHAPRRRPTSSARRSSGSSRQDIHIWSHQRYSDPPALASSELEGFTAIRKWAMQFYPDGRGGSAAELAAAETK